MKKMFLLGIVSGFFSGLSPKAPGTVGSVACVAFWWFLVNYLNIISPLSFFIYVTLIGFIATHLYMKFYSGEGSKDPQFIVIDEWIGVSIPLCFVVPESIIQVLVALILFRIFDITKPWLIKSAERLPGALGVIADDFLGGIAACGIIYLLTFFLPSFAQAEEKTNGWQYTFISEKNAPKLHGMFAIEVTVNGKKQIYRVDPTFQKVSLIKAGKANYSFPSWSPDGSKLAYVSDQNGQKKIYVADWLGRKERLLNPDSHLEEDAPSWSADSKRIAFTAGKSDKNEIYVAELYAKTISQVSQFNSKILTPRFSNDDSRISYATNRFWPGWDVCIWNIKAKIETCPLSGKVSFSRPAWSSDDSRLVYSSGQQDEMELGLIKLDNNAQLLLPASQGRKYDASFIKNDKYIIYLLKTSNQSFKVMVYDFKLRQHFPIIQTPHEIQHLSWANQTTLELEARHAQTQRLFQD